MASTFLVIWIDLKLDQLCLHKKGSHFTGLHHRMCFSDCVCYFLYCKIQLMGPDALIQETCYAMKCHAITDHV